MEGLREEIKQAIEEGREYDTRNLRIFNQVIDTLKAFNGKQISKRMATAVDKALPDYEVRYDTNYGMYQIRIWGHDIPYKNEISVLLGYATSGKNRNNFSANWVKEYNICYGSAAVDRNRKREGNLQSLDTITEVTKALIKARLEYDEMINQWDDHSQVIPDRYNIDAIVEAHDV